MADYYPLIARAIAGLDKNTGEGRRALYERARSALVAQLRGVSPALEESEITRERLALEEAIRKVEAEAARRQRSDSLAPSAPAPSPPPPPPPAPEHVEARDTEPQQVDGARPASRDQRLDALRADIGKAPSPKPTAAAPRPAASGAPTPRAAPRKPPRDPFADIPAAHDFDRLETEVAPRLDAEALRPRRRDVPLLEPMDEIEEPGPLPRPRPPRGDEDDQPVLRRAPRSYTGIIRALIAVTLIVVLAGFFYWQRATFIGLYQALRGQPGQVARDARDTKTPDGRPKISDRIGPAADRGQVAGVAQRVVLYEEEPNDPKGKQFVGSAVWRTESIPGSGNQPPELAVRADVEIPERRLAMRFSIRRNTDQALPASHTIEITFNLPADFPAGGISNVPGILMKPAEQTRGTPLAGLAVKVTNNFFLIGLSAVEADTTRNIQLLKDRAWFDIPVVYNNTRRAILAIEKGTPGERAFAEAFATWRQ